MDQNQDNIPPISIPKNINDIKKIYQQYGHFLSPQNQQLLLELIREVEQGKDPKSLQKIASKMQSAANEANDNVNATTNGNFSPGQINPQGNINLQPNVANNANASPKRQQGGNPNLTSRQQQNAPNQTNAKQQQGRTSQSNTRQQQKSPQPSPRGKGS